MTTENAVVGPVPARQAVLPGPGPGRVRVPLPAGLGGLLLGAAGPVLRAGVTRTLPGGTVLCLQRHQQADRVQLLQGDAFFAQAQQSRLVVQSIRNFTA